MRMALESFVFFFFNREQRSGVIALATESLKLEEKKSCLRVSVQACSKFQSSENKFTTLFLTQNEYR